MIGQTFVSKIYLVCILHANILVAKGSKIYLTRSKITFVLCLVFSIGLALILWFSPGSYIFEWAVIFYSAILEKYTVKCIGTYWDLFNLSGHPVTRKWCMMNSAKFINHFGKSPLIILSLKWPQNILIFIITPCLIFIIIPCLV